MSIKRHRFSFFFKASLVVAFAVALSACEVIFINPLPASLTVPRDERLLGRWVTDGDEGRPGYVMFVKGANDEINVLFEAGDPNVMFRLTSLKIYGSTYLLVKSTDPQHNEGYLLAKYFISGDRMKVWLLDDKKMRRAVESAKLKGEFGPESYSGVKVTDSAENVLRYIRAGGNEPFKLLAEFRRVADK